MSGSFDRNEEEYKLWQTFTNGDDLQSELIFGQIVVQHYKPLLSFGTKLCKDADLVRDCIQDMFIKIWQKRASLTEVKSPRFYLLGALKNQILRETNRLKWFREAEEIEEKYDLEVVFAIEHQIIMQEITAENHLKLKELLAKITKRQREAIYLRFYQDLEYAEIADIMGVTTHSVVNLIYEAVKQLRQNWFFELSFLSLLFG